MIYIAVVKKIMNGSFSRNLEGTATQKAAVVPPPMAPFPAFTICPTYGKESKISYNNDNLRVCNENFM